MKEQIKAQDPLVKERQEKAKAFCKPFIESLLESDLTYEEVEYIPQVVSGELKIIVGKSQINWDKSNKHKAINEEYSDIPFSRFKEESPEALEEFKKAQDEFNKQNQ